jgi:hypothetical protein
MFSAGVGAMRIDMGDVDAKDMVVHDALALHALINRATIAARSKARLSPVSGGRYMVLRSPAGGSWTRRATTYWASFIIPNARMFIFSCILAILGAYAANQKQMLTEVSFPLANSAPVIPWRSAAIQPT